MAEYGAELWRACVLVVALCTAAAATRAGACEFRAADTQNEDYPTVQALSYTLSYMGGLIEERSGGRLNIRVFHSRQLGEEKRTIEQTRVGAIDLNRTNVALFGSLVPATKVLAMPLLFRSTGHLRKVLDAAIGRGPLERETPESVEPHGLAGLAFYDSDARSIYNNVTPIRSIADIKEAGVAIAREFDREPLEAAPAVLHERARRDAAASALIDRIRKVE